MLGNLSAPSDHFVEHQRSSRGDIEGCAGAEHRDPDHGIGDGQGGWGDAFHLVTEYKRQERRIERG